jgi:hypothetical protein
MAQLPMLFGRSQEEGSRLVIPGLTGLLSTAYQYATYDQTDADQSHQYSGANYGEKGYGFNPRDKIPQNGKSYADRKANESPNVIILRFSSFSRNELVDQGGIKLHTFFDGQADCLLRLPIPGKCQPNRGEHNNRDEYPKRHADKSRTITEPGWIK